MVRIASTIMLMLSVAIGVNAGLYCQCLYSDGSHCCVEDAGPSTGGCTTICMHARAVGNSTPCNAGGKNSGVSAWNAQFRTACA